MWMKWLPFRMAVRHMAEKRGFLDPINLLEQLQKFAQPSEVAMPIEIIRLGTSLHARGLMNSQAIQHNLDWIWPYWVERQFDPHDIAFMPRSFSVSHINLTHRNWTAVGLPGCPSYPIVDPAGLVTPLFDAWSLDGWIMGDDGRDALIPSRLSSLNQRLRLDEGLAVVTESGAENFRLSSHVEVTEDPVSPICHIRLTAHSLSKAWCIVSLRPYNPEGVSCIHEIRLLKERHGWLVNGKSFVYFASLPDRCAFSDYRQGDVSHYMPHVRQREKIVCDVGMATAAAAYELQPGKSREILISVPLPEYNDGRPRLSSRGPSAVIWTDAMKGSCRLQIPDQRFQFLYDAALKTMVLHAPREVYPGPYTYKHFWFRDAAFILNAMLSAGMTVKTESVIDHSFFSRQNAFGYFHSQDGEWDSNGQALWSLYRFCLLTHRQPKPEWKKAIEKGALWIQRKRLPLQPASPHAGLLPAGFSAEHLGPNDYYYWDDFWGAAGLDAAARMELLYGDKKKAEEYFGWSSDMMKAVENSALLSSQRLGHFAVPASPYRRMDSGAVGSLAAGYPLRLWQPQDTALMSTVEYLLQNCFVNGGFFHDMSHAGINPYLTLHIAQVLLRAGRPQYLDLMKTIADLATPTGQWPEAVHPKTRGGCMGDGQHVWAAAEWVLMVRNCFVREEGGRLILFSGVPREWLEGREEMSFGPAPTEFGPICLALKPDGEKIRVRWEGKWFAETPVVEIHLAGHPPVTAGRTQNEIEISVAVLK